MSVRPIDLQVIIPRATEVGKVQHISDHQNLVQQEQFAEQWQQISQNREQKIQRTPKNEGGKINADKQSKQQKNNHNNQERKTKQSEKDNINCEANNDPIRGHFIDIKT